MYGLSRGEAIGVRDDFAAAVRADADALITTIWTNSREHYAQLLAVGAYPEIRASEPAVRATWFDSYLQGVIGWDMSQLRREVRPARAMAVLRALAGRQSAELVKAKLAQQTAVPPSTITGYLDLLEDLGLIAHIPLWTPKIAKRSIGRPKTSIVDSGLAM